MSLSKAQVNIFGTSPNDIDSAEDRFKFSRKLESLQIAQPLWKKSDNIEDAKQFCAKIGYPCLIRPSYVLSGAAMNVAHNEDDLAAFLKQATVVAKEHPVVVSKFISEAKEIDVDAVAKDGEVLVMAVSEHVENAGIHSGDATLVTPPQDLNQVTLDRIMDITYRIASAFNDNELKVIECNLRVSRSFPFVSKTLDFDFVALATRAMMAVDNPAIGTSLKKHALLRGKGRVGVKAPQFSFSRLAGADVMLGVEMASTGEVGCFGSNRQEAYLKALLSTGFIVPKKNIFLSIGGYHAKSEMLRSVQILQKLGFELYGSKGTADYFQSNNIDVKAVDWPFEEGSTDEKTAAGTRSVSEFFENKEFHLVINLPIRGSGAYRVSAFRTHGYKTRRMAIDNGIPLITDIKCAKLFIEEDWYSCTRAALAGGVTQILAMPNTNPPLIDLESYQMTEKLAAKQAVVDYALYVGATPKNARIAADMAGMVAGLKLFLNQTFSTLQMDSMSDWIKHFESFPTSRPIVCHAERQTLAAVLCVAQMTGRAGKRAISILLVRPRLATAADRSALWDNLEYIDCFATDHAPHTWSEKTESEKVPPGFPGVEYLLPLMLTAVSQGKLTMRCGSFRHQ
ncbi:unnamed protein product [Strongylus vulgaris]|uniref:ATP-grasp domain-containing protein n=1 Tax=Strongylus vulgaris TaxID=40348 RepID=A0A3P7JHX1_STRVU|nr:unnamed protein product [Strongylus vulgaris]